MLMFIAAAVALWVRSYRTGDSLFRVTHNGWADVNHFAFRTYGFTSARGRFGWIASAVQTDKPAKLWGASDAIERNPENSIGWHRARFPGDLPDVPPPAWGNGFGFHVRHVHQEGQMDFMVKADQRDPRLPWIVTDFRYALVPYWFAVLTCTPLTIFAMRRVARSFRAKPGHCRRCGYDMRATPDRCPECGTIPTRVKA
jgi:hypothetical protein